MERLTARPGKVKWLLSYLARCRVCEGPLQATNQKRGGQLYSCYNKRCVG